MDQGEAISAEQESSESPSSAEERIQGKLDAVTPKINVKKTRIVEDVTAAGGAEDGARSSEVSAATIARMMGLATTTELSLLEGKIDLVSTRVNGLTVRMEKVLNVLAKSPTGTDLDRIDINIGSLKTMIRETLEALSMVKPPEEEGGDLSGATIMTSDDSDADEE